MSDARLRAAVIVGSTREGRFGGTVAQWFIKQAQQRGDVDIDVIDLVDTPLPPVHREQPPPEVRDFTARIDAADMFVIVTPEYNHGYPASLKLAIDFARVEWRAKPVGFVSYGGRAGGLRAVEQLRQVFAELHMVSVRDVVSFHMAHNQFDEHGQPKDLASANAIAKTMLDQLAWWALALREARAKRPYGA